VSQDPPGQDSIRKGQVIANRYLVLDMIGQGGMGRIYKVQDNTIGEIVALKTLLPEYVQEKMVIERFFNEAESPASCLTPTSSVSTTSVPMTT
jgi:serine/threonine-protein kinase